MRMVQCRQKLRFPAESSQPLRNLGDFREEDLYGDVATEPGVPGPVDDPHPSRTQGRTDSVRTDLASFAQIHDGRENTTVDSAPHTPERLSLAISGFEGWLLSAWVRACWPFDDRGWKVSGG